jgi:hypothetical protein
MSKLAATIRNHFIAVREVETTARSSIGTGQVRTQIASALGIPRRSPGGIIPRPFAGRLRADEIEAMNAAPVELPASTRPLFPDSTWASLASKAPAVCSQLQRWFR